MPIPVLIAGEDHFNGSATTTGTLQALGVLNEPELFHLFSQSSVYIAASVYEPFGLAPLEAALCGCALVLRDIPSFREVWGDAALYFNTSTELQEQLRILAEDPSALEEARAAAQAHAGRYTADGMTAQYVTLYEELIMATQKERGTKESLAYVA
jgi:glycosyltransferase involved in cell wall biosynthesis